MPRESHGRAEPSCFLVLGKAKLFHSVYVSFYPHPHLPRKTDSISIYKQAEHDMSSPRRNNASLLRVKSKVGLTNSAIY